MAGAGQAGLARRDVEQGEEGRDELVGLACDEPVHEGQHGARRRRRQGERHRPHGGARGLGEARRPHTLAHHVAHDEEQSSVGQGEGVVKVAAHQRGLEGGGRHRGELEPRGRGQRVQEVLLQRERDALLGGVELSVLDGERYGGAELAGEVDLGFVEHPRLAAVEQQAADHSVSDEQRHRQHRPERVRLDEAHVQGGVGGQVGDHHRALAAFGGHGVRRLGVGQTQAHVVGREPVLVAHHPGAGLAHLDRASV